MPKLTKTSWLIIGFCILLAVAAYFLLNLTQSRSLVLYGNVDIRSVNASFRVAGRVATMQRDEGDTVKYGELLARIDDAPYQIAVSKAQANLAAMKAQRDLLLAGYREEEIAQAKAQVAQYYAAYQYADSNYQRQVQLASRNAVARDQVDNTKSIRDQAKANWQAAQDKLKQYTAGYRTQDIDAAKANVQLAEADLAQSKLNLADTQLLAPADGVILTRILEPGTMVDQGSPVYSLSLTQPIWIRAYVDEVNLALAQPGSQVLIYTDSQPDKAYHGQIGFVSPTAEFTPKSVETEVLRTDLVYRLRIIVADGDALLRQGMPVTIKLVE